MEFGVDLDQTAVDLCRCEMAWNFRENLWRIFYRVTPKFNTRPLSMNFSMFRARKSYLHMYLHVLILKIGFLRSKHREIHRKGACLKIQKSNSFFAEGEYV